MLDGGCFFPSGYPETVCPENIAHDTDIYYAAIAISSDAESVFESNAFFSLCKKHFFDTQMTLIRVHSLNRMLIYRVVQYGLIQDVHLVAE